MLDAAKLTAQENIFYQRLLSAEAAQKGTPVPPEVLSPDDQNFILENTLRPELGSERVLLGGAEQAARASPLSLSQPHLEASSLRTFPSISHLQHFRNWYVLFMTLEFMELVCLEHF